MFEGSGQPQQEKTAEWYEITDAIAAATNAGVVTSDLLAPAMPTALVRSEPELVEFGRDALAVLDLLTDLPGRVFGGSTREFLKAQGRPSDVIDVVMAGCVGEVTRYARADALEGPAGLRLTEINVGSELGGVERTTVNDRLLRQPDVRGVADKYGLVDRNVCAALARRLRAVSAAVVGVPEPTVALVEETGAGRSCQRIADALTDCGLTILLCELSDLTSADGKITTTEGTPIDVVLRYFFVEHLLAEPDGVATARMLADAHRRGRTAFFTSMDSAVYDNKAALAMLHDAHVRRRLTPPERALVDRVVPWTSLLSAGRSPEELIEHSRRHRERLVLKPSDACNGAGVNLGHARTDAEWERLLATAADHVVQERVQAVPELVRDPRTGEVTAWLVNWGVFIDDTGFCGAYARAIPFDDRSVIGAGNDTMRYSSVFTHPGRCEK